MKKQIFTKLTLLIVAVFTSVKVSAYDFTVDGIYYNITSDASCEVTSNNGLENSYSGSVVIPEVLRPYMGCDVIAAPEK